MRKTLTIFIMLARLLGVVQIIVGLGIWFGMFGGAAPIHSILGSLFVLTMWIVAGIALFALPKRGVALFAMLWGGLVLWFGMAQTTLLVGSTHWAIRLAHLLVGVAALGLVESLGKAVKRHLATQGK